MIKFIDKVNFYFKIRVSTSNFVSLAIYTTISPSHYHFRLILGSREIFKTRGNNHPFHARTLKLFPIFSIQPVS